MPLVSMLSSKAARGRGCVRERAPPLDAHPMCRCWTPLGEGAVLLPPPQVRAVHCRPLGEGAALQPAVRSPPWPARTPPRDRACTLPRGARLCAADGCPGPNARRRESPSARAVLPRGSCAPLASGRPASPDAVCCSRCGPSVCPRGPTPSS